MTDTIDRSDHLERGAGAPPRPRPRLPLLVGAGAHRPAADRAARRAATSGTTRASATSTSRSQLVNVNIGYQHPQAGRGDPGAGGAGCAPSRRPSPTTPAPRRPGSSPSWRPGDLNKVFFTNGGAEATENAMRMARLHTGRHKVLATYRSYHGATAGAITATGDPRRWPNEPRYAGRRALLGPVPLPLGLPRRRPRRRSASARCSTCATPSCSRARTTIAAIILETVVGTNGILVPPPGYLAGRARDLRRVRHRDDRRRGHGRVRPLRRVVRRRPLGRHARPHHLRQGRQLRLRPARRRGHLRPRSPRPSRERAFPGGLTYSGHPLACASAVASIQIFEEEGIIEHARELGEDGHRRRRCAELAEKHPSVGEVRGLGVFWALELVRDRETREPLVPYNAGRRRRRRR